MYSGLEFIKEKKILFAMWLRVGCKVVVGMHL